MPSCGFYLSTFATNTFLEKEIFTLEPSSNPPKGGVTLLVDYPDGTPCKIRCNNAGHGEIGIHVLYAIKQPNRPVYTFISKQSKEICSVHAGGWLERTTSKFLQIPPNATSIELFCEDFVRQYLAELEIMPIANSFKKNGPSIL